jgi:hypothetical protein
MTVLVPMKPHSMRYETMLGRHMDEYTAIATVRFRNKGCIG